MTEQWLLWVCAILILVIFIILGGRVPKRCDNCTYYYGNRCDRCHKDPDS